jgi:hypothetical protein
MGRLMVAVGSCKSTFGYRHAALPIQASPFLFGPAAGALKFEPFPELTIAIRIQTLKLGGANLVAATKKSWELLADENARPQWVG